MSLILKYPAVNIVWNDFFNTINKGGEIAVVIVGAAVLDELLKRMLIFFLANKSTGKKMLDHDTKPFGTFSKRIISSYVLGLINKEEFDDLTNIRKIRNEFAHNFNTASFTDHEIVKLCNKLISKDKKLFIDIMSPFDKFKLSLVFMSQILVLRPTLIEPRKTLNQNIEYIRRKKSKNQE